MPISHAFLFQDATGYRGRLPARAASLGLAAAFVLWFAGVLWEVR